MTRRFYRNGQATSLTAPVDAVSTSITVNSATSFPTQYPYTLILDPDGVLEEVVDVTAGVGNTLTIARGVDGTTASPHSAGVQVYHGVSARDADEANDHVNKTTNIHGVSGGLVGASGDQSISGVKTFTGTLATSAGAVVAVAGDQTIAGVKTFSTLPVVTGTTLVTTTGTQTVTGDKTFSGVEVHSGAESHAGVETHSGTVRFSNAAMQTSIDSSTADDLTTGIAFVSSGDNATAAVGAAFTAPPSGKVMVFLNAYFQQGINTQTSLVSFSIKTGSTPGAGSPVVASSGDRALIAGGPVNSGAPLRLQATRAALITGLTPGTAYVATVEFQTTAGGNCQVFYREIIVKPEV